LGVRAHGRVPPTITAGTMFRNKIPEALKPGA
jgi:hypothetical protein